MHKPYIDELHQFHHFSTFDSHPSNTTSFAFTYLHLHFIFLSSFRCCCCFFGFVAKCFWIFWYCRVCWQIAYPRYRCSNNPTLVSHNNNVCCAFFREYILQFKHLFFFFKSKCLTKLIQINIYVGFSFANDKKKFKLLNRRTFRIEKTPIRCTISDWNRSKSMTKSFFSHFPANKFVNCNLKVMNKFKINWFFFYLFYLKDIPNNEMMKSQIVYIDSVDSIDRTPNGIIQMTDTVPIHIRTNCFDFPDEKHQQHQWPIY